jgi:hypothetical protein
LRVRTAYAAGMTGRRTTDADWEGNCPPPLKGAAA